jgi:hypothetical protein
MVILGRVGICLRSLRENLEVVWNGCLDRWLLTSRRSLKCRLATIGKTSLKLRNGLSVVESSYGEG